MNRKLFIVVNLFAGKKRIEKLVREFCAFLESQKISFEVFDTEKEGNANATVSKNLDQQYSDLVVIGGDGTINEAVNGLNRDIPVSIIPAGTGDDFIKNVEIGKTKRQHFETALDGETIAIDLGQCNDRKFVNGIGIGFDGQIVEDMIAKRVPLLKGHAAYYYHVLRILGGYGEKPFGYKINHQVFEKDLILLTVANGTTFGGGFRLTPDADITDGLLDICEVGKLSPLKRFLNIHRLSNGTHGVLRTIRFYQASNVKVDENPLLFAHIDGERMGQPPFEIKILPKAMKLRIAKL